MGKMGIQNIATQETGCILYRFLKEKSDSKMVGGAHRFIIYTDGQSVLSYWQLNLLRSYFGLLATA